MAKSFTFTDIATPVMVSATAVSGGTLTGTQYYKVVATNSVSTNQANNYDGKSLASAQIAVTFDATHKSVTLVWTHTPGFVGSYKIFRSNSSGIFISALNVSVLATVVNSGGTCTWTDTGYAVTGNTIFQDTSHGVLDLSSSAPTTDIWSIVDLYNADVANGWGVITRLDESTYRTDTYITMYNGLLWVDEEKTIIFGDGMKLSTSSNFRFGRKTGNITNRGCRLIFKVSWLFTFAFQYLYAYKTTFDQVIDWTPYYNTYSGLGFNYVSFVNGVVEDGQSNKLRSFGTGAGALLKNFIATEYDIGFGTNSAFDNVTGMNGSRPFQTGTNTVMRVTNFKSINDTYAVLILGKNAKITFVNSVFDPSQFPSGLYDADGTYVKENFTYNLTVNENGSATPIVGAIVKIYDVFNNLICDTTTDSNGEIAEQELLFRQQDYVVKVRTSTYYSPHKLVITADGYEDYTQYTLYTEANATKQTVSLNLIKPVRQTMRGEFLIAIQPELGSDAKLLEI